MTDAPSQPSDAGDPVRSWERNAPPLRRWLARIGLQGKLILCFMYMLTLSLGVSCWVFARQSSARVGDIMGEHARQMSYALSLACKPAVEARQARELRRIGMDLLKTRNILFVSFLDETGHSLAIASRDPDFNWDALAPLRHNTLGLMQVHTQTSPVLGEYLAVVSPVVSVTPAHLGPAALPSTMPAMPAIPTTVPAGSRLLGYVVVGVSHQREQAQLSQISFLVAGVGLVVLLLSFPLSYLMVRRIFQPIRELVVATNRIAAGDLETHVAIHRPDLIGTLARSFNEMVWTVRLQQAALERTNLKLAEANIRLAGVNEQLEHKVQERTSQLEAANHRLSSEIAEKEDFLRAVSHDLNAPLRNISGMATMLLVKHREQFDADVIHRLQRIQKNVEVETDLISELLELSRIKTRRQKIEPLDLQEMIVDIGGVLENDLRTRAITLSVDGSLPVVQGEKARLRQVFQNLIDNAIKYMGDGPTREIHIGCRLKRSEAEFYVRDTGIGIESEGIGKVFFVFRRGKSPAVQNVAGKGVGLASVKSIIETYSGTIWVESQPGQGSTFRFTINGKYVPATMAGGSVTRDGDRDDASSSPKAA